MKKYVDYRTKINNFKFYSIRIGFGLAQNLTYIAIASLISFAFTSIFQIDKGLYVLREFFSIFIPIYTLSVLIYSFVNCRFKIVPFTEGDKTFLTIYKIVVINDSIKCFPTCKSYVSLSDRIINNETLTSDDVFIFDVICEALNSMLENGMDYIPARIKLSKGTSMISNKELIKEYSEEDMQECCYMMKELELRHEEFKNVNKEELRSLIDTFVEDVFTEEDYLEFKNSNEYPYELWEIIKGYTLEDQEYITELLLEYVPEKKYHLMPMIDVLDIFHYTFIEPNLTDREKLLVFEGLFNDVLEENVIMLRLLLSDNTFFPVLTEYSILSNKLDIQWEDSILPKILKEIEERSVVDIEE